MLLFTASSKQLVLDTHNALRNKIALGKEPGFKSASKMMALQWNDELAFIASLNVRQCQMLHDKCRNTFQFQIVGQNLGISVKLAQQSSIGTCCGGDNFKNIGHFLQVVQDRAAFVGCSASRYTVPNSPASKLF
ncbi:hypothetical protein PVAND_012446 [Polypedilum vanderplanki]|uniref:SCP domain-containing protein n=1 Tax=Polypedilum vanderplanki TaxID=319348 RepID=A0A9J6CMI7_POLVA|nr:hypothetical protein PVAND_012446 [Polypedilum vanderplanki]